MIELAHTMLKIMGVSMIFASGAWFFVLAQGAAKKRYTRRVLLNACYSFGYVVVLGMFTAVGAGICWIVYDLLKGVYYYG